MALVSRNVIVASTTPTLLFTQKCFSGGDVSFTNLDASIDLLLGDNDMSRTDYGHYIAKGGGEHTMFLPYGESVYGCCASGVTTITTNVMAVGQPS